MTDRSVLFLNLHKGEVSALKHWDAMHLQAALADVVPDWCWFEEALPLSPPPGVVLISGQHHTSPDDLAHIRGVLDSLERCVVIVHSDEASIFPWYAVDRPGIKWWISTPRHDVHHPLVGQARFFGEGPGPTPERGWPIAAKRIDVQFAGQSTHVRRRECVQALRDLKRSRPDLRVEVHETAGFMQGVSRSEYLTELAMSKIVLCPSGIQTVDSFRLYEAIECGAVPIVERRTPDGEDHRQWELVYADDMPPFPILDHWGQLEEIVWDLLEDDRWREVAQESRHWWGRQQQNLRTWLAEDLGLT